MNRRAAIRNVVIFSAGAALLPSCMQDTGKASILLKKISISSDQEKLLAELTETILPKTDGPGAKDISAHLFALMMVDDCYKKEDQQKFMAGIIAFEAKAKKQFGKPFIDCNAKEKEGLLTELEANRSGDENLAYFYSTVKKLTIQAYTTSKFYLTNVKVYKLVPGPFSGCVPVKNAS